MAIDKVVTDGMNLNVEHYHAELKSATSAVTRAGDVLRKQILASHSEDPAYSELVAQSGHLQYMEEMAQKKVKEADATLDGLMGVIRVLEGYGWFIEDFYSSQTSVSHEFPREKKDLDDALEQQFKLIKDVQDNIKGPAQSQMPYQEAISSTISSDTNQQLMDNVAKLDAQVRDMQARFLDYVLQTQASIQEALDAQASQMQASMQTVVNDAVQQLFIGLNPTPDGSTSNVGSSTSPTLSGTGMPASGTGTFAKGSTSSSSPDIFFWLRGKVKNKEILLTEKLLNGPLNDLQDQRRLAKITVDKLINDWEKAMNAFVDQTKTIVTNGDAQQIAIATSALFSIHKQLQTLYNNLNATVIQQQPDIVQI